MLIEQFQSVFTDDDMQNIPSCKKLILNMTEINLDIDGVIKQLQRIDPIKANDLDEVPTRFPKKSR